MLQKLSVFLVLQVQLIEKGILNTQNKYINELLKKFGISHPMYGYIIGSLLYLTTYRLDDMQVVGITGRC